MPQAAPQEFDEKSISDFLGDAPNSPSETAATVPQDTSLARYPKLALNALTGGANLLLGLPGEVNKLNTDAMFGLGNLITGKNLSAPAGMYFGTPQQLFGITNRLGLTNRPEAIPSTPAERYATAAVEGAVPGLLGGPVGVAAGATGGVTGQAVHDVAPNAPWWVAPLASVTAGFGVGGLAGLGKNALMMRGLRNELNNAQLELEASRNAAEVADNVKYFSPREREAVLAQHNAGVDAQLESMASQLGISRTLEDAGGWLQDHARNWLSNVFPKKAEMLSAPLDAAIPSGTMVDLTPYKQALKSVTSKAGALQSSANVVRSAEAQQLLNRLEGMESAAELAGESGGPLMASWADARGLRSEIGDALHSPKLAGNKDLEAAYKGLTESLGKTAESVGAGDAWNQYNTGMSQLYGFIKGPLSKIIKSDTGGRESILPSQAYSGAMSLARKGGSTLAALRAEMPDAVNEVAATVLRNPSEWSKLSPEAKAALVPGPSAAGTVDSLLESKALAESAAQGEAQRIADAARAARLRASNAAGRVEAARNALMGNRTESSALLTHLVHTGLGAGVGWENTHSMKGALLGALAGSAAPTLARGLQMSLSPNQLFAPALAGYGGYGLEPAAPPAQR